MLFKFKLLTSFILLLFSTILEKMQEEYPAVPLLRTLAETEEKAIRKHGGKMFFF